MMDVLPLVVALVASTILTPIVRFIAVRAGMVAQPKTDRWHKRPTALLGGVSIAISVALTWLAFSSRMPSDRQGWLVLAGSLFLGGVGFVDDVLHIKPYQ